MWKRLLARTHPDAGGDDDLFVWARNLQEQIDQAGAIPPLPDAETLRQGHAYQRHRPGANRIPFDRNGTDDLAAKAVAMGRSGGLDECYARLLRVLEDYPPTGDENEAIGASYPILAAIGHRVGMSKSARSGWYRVAEAVPLSQAHAAHIIGRVKVGGDVV